MSLEPIRPSVEEESLRHNGTSSILSRLSSTSKETLFPPFVSSLFCTVWFSLSYMYNNHRFCPIVNTRNLDNAAWNVLYLPNVIRDKSYNLGDESKEKEAVHDSLDRDLGMCNEEKSSHWHQIVSDNRSGRPSKVQDKEYDCIAGPMFRPVQCRDAKEILPVTKEKPRKKRRNRNELEKVCVTLGLRKNFLNRLKSIPEDIRCHRSTERWVSILIEYIYNDIEKQPLKTKLCQKLLRTVVFFNFSVMKTIMTRSNEMKHHLYPIDFIQRFVKDEFKYNPTLSEYAQEEERTVQDSLSEKRVQVLKLSGFNHEEESDDCHRLYHGTDLFSAADIINHGIKVDYGMLKRDFSDGFGFYLTNFEQAKTWAKSLTQKPVVLELKITKTCLAEARTLDLSNEEKRTLWRQIVSDNRSGRPSKVQDKDYDCIAGPMSRPVLSCDEEKEANPLREPEPGSYQLCVLNKDIAAKISYKKHTSYTLYTDISIKSNSGI